MDSERVILHSDMNSFYASVEMMLNPELKGKPVAVCGSTEERHGIVLAKSDLAKKAGVKNRHGKLGSSATLPRTDRCTASVRPVPQVF